MKPFLFTLLIALPAAGEVRLIGRPDTAVQVALEDVARNPDCNPFYVWIRDNTDADFIAVADWWLNTALSRSNTIQRSVKIEGGAAGTLLRLELDRWLPTDDARTNFVQAMRDYVDPHFYSSAGTVKLRFDEVPEFDHNGQKFTQITLDAADLKPHVEGIAELQELTGLSVPIVEAERFMVFALRTLEGGLYYRLQGIDSFQGTTRVRQTLEQWLETFGANEAESEALGGEEYVSLWRSDVTGKPRRAKAIYGRVTRPSAGAPLIVITQDGSDDQTDADQHPLYSLLNFEFAALESIAVRPNGMLSYVLHAADGTLQDSAPDNVVHDHNVPKPHTSRLEGAISCIRCHSDQNQWKPLRNDAKALLSRLDGRQVVAVADNGEDVRERIRSLYSGDLERALQLARDAFERASIAATDLKLEGDGYAVKAADVVSERFGKYLYDPVDAQEALRTLGIVATPEESPKALRELLPELDVLDFDPAAITLQTDGKGGKTASVIRADWERIYPATLAIAIQTGTVDVEKPSPKPDVADRGNGPDLSFVGPMLPDARLRGKGDPEPAPDN